MDNLKLSVQLSNVDDYCWDTRSYLQGGHECYDGNYGDYHSECDACQYEKVMKDNGVVIIQSPVVYKQEQVLEF